MRSEQTLAEKTLWNYLRDRSLLAVKFKRQYSIDNYVIDFYSPELKLAVELDGNIHDLPAIKEKDHLKEKHIADYGIVLIRITNEELFGNGNKAVERIEEKIKEISNSVNQSKNN